MKARIVVLAMAIVATPGCVMSQYRQQAVEYALERAAKARDGIVAAAEAGRDVAEELASAAVEERPPEVARPMERLVVALSAAHEEADEAGKTLAVMQEDLGRPETPPPQDPESADAWRMQYRAASRLWKMAMSWARSNMPFLGKMPGSAQAAPGGGWSPAEIAGLVTAITAALAGVGEATRRGVKGVRPLRHALRAALGARNAVLRWRLLRPVHGILSHPALPRGPERRFRRGTAESAATAAHPVPASVRSRPSRGAPGLSEAAPTHLSSPDHVEHAVREAWRSGADIA